MMKYEMKNENMKSISNSIFVFTVKIIYGNIDPS